MNYIKLDAIDSTNNYLKSLSSRFELENFTVVTTENQTSGKGQHGASWYSEPGKNLMASVLVVNAISSLDNVFDLNVMVSLAVVEVLQTLLIPDLSIKWPNDIMSQNKKIGGILIENSIKTDGSIHSIIGIGLNVNQIIFENLPKASSLCLVCGQTFDKGQILHKVVTTVKSYCIGWKHNRLIMIEKYTDFLFKNGTPMPFQDRFQKKFMGIIKGISGSGKLLIKLEDDSVSEFSIKEVQMLYS